MKADSLRLWLSALLIATGGGALPAQRPGSPTSAVPSDSVTATAGPEYSAGWLHRLLLGAHYRDLWTTPLRVALLDLSRFGGGLTAERRGGGQETKSLRLRAADGHVYAFRSVDKDVTLALPADLRQTFFHRLLQDQISSSHPAAALVMDPLLQATGVLHEEAHFFVMPSDPRLQAFPEFQGMLGELEERPKVDPEADVAFADAEKIATSQKLWRLITRDPTNRVDSRAFLAARLLDIYVGDWDRGDSQWRWARFDEGGVRVWRPIPRDRDQAFSRFDGLLPWLAHFYITELVGFGDRYPSMVGLTWDGRVLDRRVLTDLEKPVWDSVAAAIEAQLTNSVIDAAVGRLPREYATRSGAALAHTLRRRRDQLGQAADAFYRLLARDVDVHGTDAADLVDVDRTPDGSVAVRLSARGATAGAPRAPSYYARTFHPHETHEVRLYLHQGDDRVVLRGAGRGDIRIRVITGGGRSELVDSSRGGPTTFYVDHTPARLIYGPHSSLDRREFSQGPPDDPAIHPLRDWGSRWETQLLALYTADLGVGVGYSATHTWYAFRASPYKTKVTLGAGYAFGAKGVRGDFAGDFRDVGLGLDADLRLRGSEIEVLRFYGVGNETQAPRPDAYYKISGTQYLAAVSVVARASQATGSRAGTDLVRFSLGPVLKYSTTTLTAGTLIDSIQPYGVRHFLQYGAATELRLDARDRPRAATRGALLTIGGSWYPTGADVALPFGEAHGEAAAYVSAGTVLRPTFALRVAGKKVWGTYPFHEAAYVGGATTVRGFPEHRFAGDGALYGNSELRLRLGQVFLLVPADFGIFGLADVGRVYVAGESSDRWHTGIGGGVWLAFLGPANTLSGAAAHSVEGTRIYVTAGFGF